MRGCRDAAPLLTSTVSVVDRTHQLHYILFILSAEAPFHNSIDAFRRKAVYKNEKQNRNRKKNSSFTFVFVDLLLSLELWESTDEKAGRLRRSAEQLGNQVSEQQERINDFQSDWDNYKKLESELNALR